MDKKRLKERISEVVIVKSETKNTTAYNYKCLCLSYRSCFHDRLLYLPSIFLRIMPHDEKILQ